jgi:hypothetical protein
MGGETGTIPMDICNVKPKMGITSSHEKQHNQI